MSIVYATAADYAAYTGGDAPANITMLLRAASRLVTDEIVTALYDTGDDGLPTDTSKAQALKDATCEQAATWVATGVDPSTVGLQAAASPMVASKSLDGASISYDNSLNASVAAMQVRQQVTSGLTDQARLILQEAGLTSTMVWSYG